MPSEFKCVVCTRTFRSADAIRQHRRDAPNHHYCLECNEPFATADDLKNHYMDSGSHHFCIPCSRVFSTNDALIAHYKESSKHNYCFPCAREFKTRAALKKHQKSYYDHRFCGYCDVGFQTAEHLDRHNHETHFVCSVCSQIMNTLEDKLNHTVDNHPYCSQCDLQAFRTEHDLAQHMASRHDLHEIVCQGSGCGKAFKLWGALSQHYESGGCPSGLNRQQLNKLVVRLFQSKALPGVGDLLVQPGKNETKPSSSESCWNGHGYDCPCNKEFKSLQTMYAHLRGPGHDARAYQCLNHSKTCGVEFGTFGAVMQHLESGKCGMKPFNKAKKGLQLLNCLIETATF